MTREQERRYHVLQSRGGPWGDLTLAECDEWMDLCQRYYADEWTPTQALRFRDWFTDMITVRQQRIRKAAVA